MNKRWIYVLLLWWISFPVLAQQQDKMDWWNAAKFGLFVHWGPYSIYGGVYHGYQQQRGGAEWIMNRCKIPVLEYKAAASTFNPIHFDADKLVLMAKDAGMKYIVFTTKHHDGFAMFKSDASTFNIVDYTPFKRDIVDELVQACRRHDMKIGFYYSQSQDWNNAGGATARKEMREGWANPDSTFINDYTKSHHGSWDAIQTSVSFDDYFHRVAIPQVKELLGRYGKEIGVIFFDTPMSITDEQAEEMKALTDQYPQIILNDRLKRPNFPGDYKTPEGRVPKPEDVKGVYWETCMNIGSSWGYKSWDKSWKSSTEIIRTLLTIAARGGNLLLNVGPDSLGDVPAEAQNCLKEVGEWIHNHEETLYGTQRTELYPAWGQCIRKDLKRNSVLYLCVFDWPTDGKLILQAPYKVKKATLLSDGTRLNVKANKGKIIIDVPESAPNRMASVIKLELNKKLPAIKLISNTAQYFQINDTAE